MPFALIRDLFAGRLPALVIFDLDGTLIDSAPDIARALDATLHERGLPTAGEQRVRQWVGRGSRRLLHDALVFAVGAEPSSATLDTALAAYLGAYLADCARDTRLLAGAAELIDALARERVRIACATNKPLAISERVLQHFGLRDRFDAVLGGDSGAGVKPDPGPLLGIMADLGVAPADSLMIGDSRHDVHAARAAGVHVICRAAGYNHGADIRDDAPDRVVAQLHELL